MGDRPPAVYGRALIAAAATAATLTFATPASAQRDATEPSFLDRVAGNLETALDSLGEFEERARTASDWLSDAWLWLDEVGAWQQRNHPLAQLIRTLTYSVDHLLAVVDPAHRLPRFDRLPYRIMTVQPVAGKHTSNFGMRFHPVLKRNRMHKGIDFRGDRGTPVHASAPGVVTLAGRWGAYGNCIVIEHGLGVETRYAHLSRLRVREGDFVGAGAFIGNVGATGRVTGPHLHFEVRYHGVAVPPEKSFVAGEELEPAPTDLGEMVVDWMPDRILRNW